MEDQKTNKSQVRILGIDDASFTFGEDKTKVVGVVVRCPGYVEGVMMSDITIDGLDSTEVVIRMVNRSRYKRQLKLIIIDGAALGGFNVVDIHRINSETGIAVATVTRDRPNFKYIEKALRSHFDDWEYRLKLMKAIGVHEVPTENKPVYVGYAGMEFEELKALLANATLRGALPEAVRLAHLIGAAFVKGESHGRA